MNRRDTVLALLALGAATAPIRTRAQGIKIQQSVLLRATRVVE